MKSQQTSTSTLHRRLFRLSVRKSKSKSKKCLTAAGWRRQPQAYLRSLLWVPLFSSVLLEKERTFCLQVRTPHKCHPPLRNENTSSITTATSSNGARPLAVGNCSQQAAMPTSVSRGIDRHTAARYNEVTTYTCLCKNLSRRHCATSVLADRVFVLSLSTPCFLSRC
jgi:hypothetical protein